MCVQHFGFIEFVQVQSLATNQKRDDWLQVIDDSKVQLQTNSIFQASKTCAKTKYPEYALGTFTGLTFI